MNPDTPPSRADLAREEWEQVMAETPTCPAQPARAAEEDAEKGHDFGAWTYRQNRTYFECADCGMAIDLVEWRAARRNRRKDRI
jgi:hypothetical protein